MGKSRSATVLIAYLLWASRHRSQDLHAASSDDADVVAIPTKPLSVVQALELLRRGRPIVEPNEGFMDQLHMYEAMNCPTTDEELQAHKKYRRWMNKRNVEESLRINQAPDMDYIIFEDEPSEPEVEQQKIHRNDPDAIEEVSPGVAVPDGSQQSKPSYQLSQPNDSPQVTIKCRKCRHVLATTPFIVRHKPPPHRDPNDRQQAQEHETPLPPSQCAHIFLHPLSWMREVLSDGKMEGRLSCPSKKCGVNVGKFAWTGLRCSCGGWETPGFGLIRGKVDEVIVNDSGESSSNKNSNVVGRTLPGGATLRMPPGMRKGNL